ncbi:MAG: hypothetical protein KGO05_10575 [Chloroflexota bacterium]|nr:hypothetical protein [Chloroflexota bacterium]
MSDPILTITSRENAVELILTEDTVRMKLSDAVLKEARDEMAADPDTRAPGLTGKFVRAITGAVNKFISSTIDYPLYDIASVEDRAGTLVFTYLRRQRPSFEDIHIGDNGGRAALASFAPADTARFAAEFAALKAKARG